MLLLIMFVLSLIGVGYESLMTLSVVITVIIFIGMIIYAIVNPNPPKQTTKKSAKSKNDKGFNSFEMFDFYNRMNKK